jgi:hypothetical protein
MMNERDDMPYQEYGYTRPYRGHTRQFGGAKLSLSLVELRCKVQPLNYKRANPLFSRDTSTPVVTRLKKYYDQHYTVLEQKLEPV